MPAPSPELTTELVAERARACFVPDGGRRVGLEVEWIVVDETDPTRPVPAQETLAAAGGSPLPAGGSITVEPGGQLELSSAHRVGPGEALDVTARDGAVLHDRCRAAGLGLVPIGLDPLRAGRRTLDLPRYRAMEVVFDRGGPRAMTMATSSASVQLNLDVGDDPVRTWRTAGLVGPVLLAAFANSPFHLGGRSGWKSTRQLFWWTTPGGRAEPVPTWTTDAWVERVLDTDVLCLFDGDDAVAGPAGFRFRDWVEHGHELGFPTAGDLDYHLTTLFPPVRPRGWLELRMIDAVPEPARRVATALAATLLGDAEVAAAAATVCLPVAGRWHDAARWGMSHAGLARAAARCLDLAADALGTDDLAEECRDWRARYVDRGRCPADDLLAHPDPRRLPGLCPEVPLA